MFIDIDDGFLEDLNVQDCASNSLCSSPAWWLWRGVQTRSHLELGRKSLQRQWYFVLRRGRVGRCQACEEQKSLPFISISASKPAAAEMHGGFFSLPMAIEIDVALY